MRGLRRQIASASKAALLLALVGCAGGPSPQALEPGHAVTLTVAPARQALAAARSWQPSDVVRYDVRLRRYDAASGAYVELPTPLATSLPAQGALPARATFPGLAHGERYMAEVTAHGNAGGTAPDRVLNATRPATAAFDLGATPPVDSRTVTVRLDPVVFSGTVMLPSNHLSAGSVPTWVSSLRAELIDPALPASTVALVNYPPARGARFENVRGDVAYTLALTSTTAWGQTRVEKSLKLSRQDGTEQVVTPSFPPFTGMRLSTAPAAAMSTGAAGVAAGLGDDMWVTNPSTNTVTHLDLAGNVIGAPVAAGTSPRAIAVDRASGDVWVTNYMGPFSAGSISKIANGVLVGTYPVAATPTGLAIDGQGRVWVASSSLFGAGTLQRFSPAGVEQANFTVGAMPGGVAIDGATGDAWVVNAADRTVSKVANDVLQGPFAAGVNPAGFALDAGSIAVDANGIVWVTNVNDSTVRRLNRDGSSAGPARTAMYGATVMAVHPASGAVWVSLTGTNQVAKLRPDGTVAGVFPAHTYGSGIGFDRNGHVRITGNTGFVFELAP